MKKLIAILMVVMMATFAFGAGWLNAYRGTEFEAVDEYTRFPTWND